MPCIKYNLSLVITLLEKTRSKYSNLNVSKFYLRYKNIVSYNGNKHMNLHICTYNESYD